MVKNNSEIIAENKQAILRILSVNPATTHQLSKMLQITLKQAQYYLRTLEKTGHVIKDNSTRNHKLFSATGKKYDIVTQGESHITYPAPNVMVVRNSKRPPGAYSWQRKKYKSTTSMQSGMALFETA